jgi:uncharacterized protein
MTDIDFASNHQVQERRYPKMRAALDSAFSSPWRIALFYLAWLILAEGITTLIEPRVGLVLHGLVLVALFLQASFRDQGRQRGFLLSLAMAPLIRIISLSLPLPTFPFIYWYMVVGAPLLIAAFVASRIGKISIKMLGISASAVPIQLLIALIGVGLGYLEFLILRPAPLTNGLSLGQIWLPALILLIFTGFLEEWIFRGLLQYTAVRSFGWAGFFYTAAVFAVLHLGYHSALDIVFVFAVALLFGWVVIRTGSIIGVTLAHGLTNIGLYLVFPFLLPALIAAPIPTNPPQLPTPAHAAPPPGLIAPAATPTVVTLKTQIYPDLSPSLPENTPVPCGLPAEWVPYKVKFGDSLFGLALITHTNPGELRQANCLQTNLIWINQVIYLPVAIPGSSVTATPSPAEPGDTHIPTFQPTPSETMLPTVSP